MVASVHLYPILSRFVFFYNTSSFIISMISFPNDVSHILEILKVRQKYFANSIS